MASPRGIRARGGLQSEFLNTFKKLGTRARASPPLLISRGNVEAIISRSLFRLDSTRNGRNFWINLFKRALLIIFIFIEYLPNCNSFRKDLFLTRNISWDEKGEKFIFRLHQFRVKLKFRGSCSAHALYTRGKKEIPFRTLQISERDIY